MDGRKLGSIFDHKVITVQPAVGEHFSIKGWDEEVIVIAGLALEDDRMMSQGLGSQCWLQPRTWLQGRE